MTGKQASQIIGILSLAATASIPLISEVGRAFGLKVASYVLAASTIREELRPEGAMSASTKQPGYGDWGDLQDGSYVNPVLPGDFSDLDVIRVEQDFYAITSTMQYSPGMAILHSRDLVNWTIAGHVTSDISALDPALNWTQMNRAGRGIWAGSIRYHEGRFWVYFGTPDQGIFMSSSSSAYGGWTAPKLVLSAPGWDDPCPFWDDDGQGYMVATHFAPEGAGRIPYTVHLFKMAGKNDQILRVSDRVIHHSKGSEANKLYKINGLYYHFYSEVRPEGRVPIIERSRSLNGPWQPHLLMHVHAASDGEPNQGGLVELSSGKWFFLSHQGHGDWEGRAGVLLPVTWIDGWPIPGIVGKDKVGTMMWGGQKPIQGFPLRDLVASDSFDATVLKPEWEWNYQPRGQMWSLTAHPGFLRMYAFPSRKPHDFHTIGNMLTQRSLSTRENEAIVKLDLRGMIDGQQAGLAHFATHYCSIQIDQEGSRRSLQYEEDGTRTPGPILNGDSIYLRSRWNSSGRNVFSYRDEGEDWKPVGPGCDLSWGDYRGDRIGIFTTNQKATAGYVDVDWFQYHVRRE